MIYEVSNIVDSAKDKTLTENVVPQLFLFGDICLGDSCHGAWPYGWICQKTHNQ